MDEAVKFHVEKKEFPEVIPEDAFLTQGKEEIKINLNDRVKVKLTVLGIKTYIDYMNEANEGRTMNVVIKPKNCVPTIDDEGYTFFQLWELFNIYGEHMTMASVPMFLPLEIVKA